MRDRSPDHLLLLDDLRSRIRARHLSHRTEQAYASWADRYIRFHRGLHPARMGTPEIDAFLTYLSVRRGVSASTHNQAASALLFLYREVLGVDVERPGSRVIRARSPTRLPVVLTANEVRSVLDRMHGPQRLIATLLYGSGMRLMECMRLRVKDVDFQRREILIREGKADRDRVTMLPESVRGELGRWGGGYDYTTWMNARQDIINFVNAGQDGAWWMAVNHVLLTEFHHQKQTVVPGQAGNRLQIDQGQQGIGRRFHPDHARLRPDSSGERSRIRQIGKGNGQSGSPPADPVKQAKTAAVKVVHGQNMGARVKQFEHSSDGGHPRGEGKSVPTRF